MRSQLTCEMNVPCLLAHGLRNLDFPDVLGVSSQPSLEFSGSSLGDGQRPPVPSLSYCSHTTFRHHTLTFKFVQFF